MIRLDVHYLFKLAGGPKRLIELIEKHSGVTLPYPTVQMWHQRDTLPARWMALVLYVMIREGHTMLPLFTDDEALADHDTSVGG